MRAMKDSGIEWIGEIPEGWTVLRMKFCGELDSNGVDKKQREDEILYKSVHYMDVYSNSLHEIGNNDEYLIISADDRKSGICNLKKGDVLLTTSSENPEDMGHSVVISEDLVDTLFGYHLMRFRPTIQLSLHLEKYLFGSHFMRQWFEYRSTGMTRYGISRIDIADAKLILPPLPEQTRIASFLDKKCTAIDSAIEKQRASIDKLKEYRQAVITEAVTKGLNPDVPMKDSGVEWIGEIPEGWSIRKLGSIADIQTGPFGSQLHNEDYVDEGTPIITVEHFGDNCILHENLPFVSENDVKRLKKYILHPGDLVFSRVGSVDRNVVVSVAEDGWMYSGRCLRVRLSKGMDVNFLSNCFNKLKFKEYMKLVAVGATMLSINTTILSNLRIPVPLLDEQTRIATFLDRKCTAIDEAVAKKETLIEKLVEYKKSLIYEAVTGKIEVPELSA